MIRKFLPAVLADVSAALSELLLMASSAWLIATAALHPPISALSVGITLVRTAGISRAVLRYADRFIAHKIIFRLLDELREDLFRRAAKIFPLKSGRAHEGELLHALTINADLLKDFLPRVVLPIATAALACGLLTFFLPRDFALMLPLLLLINFLPALMNFDAADDTAYREKILDFNDGRDELKIFGTAPAVKALDLTATDFSAQSLKLTARRINLDTALRIVTAAGFFFMPLKLAAVVDKISLTVWTLLFLSTQEIFAQIPQAIRTWKRLRAVNLYDEKISPAQILPTAHAVELQGVTFGYGGEKIFRGLNLTIERGERVALVGESGSGKTTLLYLLTGLFAPEAGTVALGGKVAASTSTNVIFAASIRENFRMLHADIPDEKIFAALKLCGLEGFDIDAEIGFDGAKLSGGERNRLQVALAVASGAEILILDEPTAGLDKIRADNLIANLIAAQSNGQTLIVITHDSNYFADLGRVELVHQENFFQRRQRP
ncbi:MAG: ATP-binding cassette domain-containing protein [Quinella sp. 2Q5]|nr:ATP-binding cassette domain-containing protein [Quinella sp. 2Q5]